MVFEGGHSHPMATEQQLRVLPLSSTTKHQMKELFRLGLNPSAAWAELCRGKSGDQLADSSTCPTKRVFYHHFEKFNASINGDMGGDKMWDLVANLEDKIPGVRMAYQRPSLADDKDMGIAILTPLMSRVHTCIPQSGEILYVETMNHIDLMNTCVTIMMTSSPTGAVPLGVLLTNCQTERAYRQGFELWKSLLPTTSFYGVGSPRVIMTDDSDAQRSALSACFPTAAMLLCQVRVQQAMWRWLWDTKHGVAKEDRQVLMKLFKNVVNANSVEWYHQAVMNLLHDSKATRYEEFMKYIDGLLHRADLFVLAFRSCELTREHSADNFLDSVVRIFRELMCDRRLAYNTYELAVILADRFEDVVTQRILDVALGKRKVLHNFSIFESTNITNNMITTCPEDAQEFVVCSDVNQEHSCTVNMALRLCTCSASIDGQFCKHLAAVEHYHPESVNIHKMMSPQERHQLATLAVGTSTASDESLFGIADAPSTSVALKEPLLTSSVETYKPNKKFNVKSEIFEIDSTNERIEKANDFIRSFTEHIVQHINHPSMIPSLEAMNRTMDKMNANSFTSALRMFGREGVGGAGGLSVLDEVMWNRPVVRRVEGKPRGRKRKALKQQTEPAKQPCNSVAETVSMDLPNPVEHAVAEVNHESSGNNAQPSNQVFQSQEQWEHQILKHQWERSLNIHRAVGMELPCVPPYFKPWGHGEM
jgi:hypothetical protein